MQDIVVIEIPYEMICDMLNFVEKENQIHKGQIGNEAPLPPNCELAIWNSSPPKELSPRKERKFAVLEGKDEERAEIKDPEWSNKRQKKE